MMFSFALMQEANLEQVMEIEKDSFAAPWSKSAFQYELQNNDFAHYLVALSDCKKVVGYGGMWIILDEAHVTNIAVAGAEQRVGLGRSLMLHLIQRAVLLGCRAMTLEVRSSNQAAIALYTKLGFKNCGYRKNYYQKTKEDALIMWLNDLGR